MSTSADGASTDTVTTRRAGTPIYKRRRRRIYGIAGVAVVLVIALIVWAVTPGRQFRAGHAAQLHGLGQPGQHRHR